MANQAITNAIKEIDKQRNELRQQLTALTRSRDALCEAYDICQVCLGEKTYYDKRKEDLMDPFHKSSDCIVPCKACNGTGKPRKEVQHESN